MRSITIISQLDSVLDNVYEAIIWLYKSVKERKMKEYLNLIQNGSKNGEYKRDKIE